MSKYSTLIKKLADDGIKYADKVPIKMYVELAKLIVDDDDSYIFKQEIKLLLDSLNKNGGFTNTLRNLTPHISKKITDDLTKLTSYGKRGSA